MTFAILLQNYFPYGGLQRDAVRLAEAAIQAGDRPTLVVSTWDGPKPTNIPIITLNSGGSSNHSKAAQFASDCQSIIASEEFDTSISFSRVPGAPYYFCGDACFLEKFTATKPPLTRHLPRYRFFLENELRIFGSESDTHMFFLAAQEVESYRHHYHLSGDRFTTLPPWMNPPQSFSESRDEIRRDLFTELHIPQDAQLLLFVGSNFKLKRLHTLIEAMPDLDQRVHLAVCGRDNLTPPQKLAKSLGISNRVHLMGPQDDIPRWMSAADLLVHPSIRETAGMVLVEALSYGLPVTCTALCGYAHYVKEAGGSLLSENCPPEEITKVATEMLTHLPELRQQALAWSTNPSHYQTADLILLSMRNSLR